MTSDTASTPPKCPQIFATDVVVLSKGKPSYAGAYHSTSFKHITEDPDRQSTQSEKQILKVVTVH